MDFEKSYRLTVEVFKLTTEQIDTLFTQYIMSAYYGNEGFNTAVENALNKMKEEGE